MARSTRRRFGFAHRILFLATAIAAASPALASTPTVTGITSSSTSGAFVPGNANDGSTATFFSSTLYGDPNHVETLTIDFGTKLYSLTAIVLTSRQNGYGFPADFKIQLSDNGSTWTDVPDASFQNFSNPGTQSMTVAFRNFVAARYLRVSASKLNPDSGGSYALQFTEVSAQQKFPTVGGSTVAGNQLATNAFDGNYATYYSSSSHAGATSAEWLGLDLGTATTINALQLVPRPLGYGFPTAYKAQASADAITWTDIPRTAYSGVPNPGSGAIDIPFETDISARYFRLYATTLGADNVGTFSLQLAEMSASNIVPRVAQTISSSAASSVLSGWPLSGLTDGSVYSSWSSALHATNAATESFTLSYAAPAFLTKLAVTPREGGFSFPVDFKLQSSADGTTFTDIPGQAYTAYPNPGSRRQVFSFDPVTAKALRLVAAKLGTDGSNYYLQIAEAAGYVLDSQADTWSATDDLGRAVLTAGQVPVARAGKFTAMFYYLWHGNYGYPITDITQLLTANPGALTTIDTDPPWEAYGRFHHWGKPLLDYYQAADSYVLRKHGQMLADAGIDTVVFDTSNFDPADLLGSFFKAQWMALFDAWSAVRAQGGKTPQVMFLCPFYNSNINPCVNQLYTDLYSANIHPELWFMGYGKPVILADRAAVTNSTQLNFFTFRKPLANSPTIIPNEWGVLEKYPQPAFYSSAAPSTPEQVPVGVAQNVVPDGNGGWRLAAFSERNASGQLAARGRSFHNGTNLLSTNPLNPNYQTAFGYNFAEQWGRGLDLDPSVMFVNGWNEWIAGRSNSFNNINQINLFPDEFNQEFSRDIEPMTGGHKDNYYVQLADYVRRFKGARQLTSVGVPKTIAIDGSFADWTDVKAEFVDDMGDTAHRSNANWDASATLTDTSGRNDIQVTKVARDAHDVYFYVKTAANITPYTDSNWMRLFIRTTGTAGSNWEGYNFVVNRTVLTSITTKLEPSTGGWAWGTATTVSYRASGREMEIAVPRSALGLAGTGPLRFDFKWADNIVDAQDSMEFYTHGDAAPNERFRYRFDEFPLQ